MSSSSAPGDPSAGDRWDPTFLHSRREAIMIVGVWALCLLWAVPYCYLQGYRGDAGGAPMATVLGFPSWIFWGIGLPWLLADVFTTWFCFCYMKDDDLGEAHEGLDIEEEIAETRAGDREASE